MQTSSPTQQSGKRSHLRRRQALPGERERPEKMVVKVEMVEKVVEMVKVEKVEMVVKVARTRWRKSAGLPCG